MTRVERFLPGEAGWPRERLAYKDDHLPAPWIMGDEWMAFGSWAKSAVRDRLCQVCGEALGRRIILLRSSARLSYVTSGTGCHPRCAWTSLRACPHLAQIGPKMDEVGYLYEGDGDGMARLLGEDVEPLSVAGVDVSPSCASLSIDEVRRIAMSDPMGTAT